MEIPDEDHRAFGRVLSMKQSAIASILTAMARTRKNLVQPETDEGLDALLRLVEREKSSQAVPVRRPARDPEIDRLFS